MRSLVISFLLGTALSVLFWPTLWQGGGLVGGDIYTYYLPQKSFLVERMQEGELPLWNNRTGHGYPFVGESQCGVFYPPHQLIYRLFDLNTAYSVVHLAHYVLAFVGCWLLAKRLSLNNWGAALAATVYLYGWFPARACLEWAIIGGAWLPWALWSTECYLQSGRGKYLAALAGTFAMSLLAGHFNFAFITTLITTAYLVGRGLWFQQTPDNQPVTSKTTEFVRFVAKIRPLLLAIVIGYLLAAPQLLSSWNLKQFSQREGVIEEADGSLTLHDQHADIGQGHIPPLYLSQVFMPWDWFGSTTDPDLVLNTGTLGGIAAPTNKVEAHLYFGLIPLLLAVLYPFAGHCPGSRLDRRLIWLGLLGLLALVYATGWLLPLFQYLPGFNFFRGPGRYGVITTLSVGLFAGAMLSRWTTVPDASSRALGKKLLALTVLALTLNDLRLVKQHEWEMQGWLGVHNRTPFQSRWYAEEVPDVSLDRRDDSPVRTELIADAAAAKRAESATMLPRVLAPGGNLTDLTGFSATPPYLGFGPSAYFSPGGYLPDRGFLKGLSGDEALPPAVDVAAQIAWLKEAGVTHILSMKRLPSSIEATLLWTGTDPFLNRAWGRQEPLFLYRLNQALGRYWLNKPGQVRLQEYRANAVELEVTAPSDTVLTLADLPTGDWHVFVDDVSVLSDVPSESPAKTLQRRVAISPGTHVVRWEYSEAALWWGFVMSGMGGVGLLAFCRGNQPVVNPPTLEGSPPDARQSSAT